MKSKNKKSDLKILEKPLFKKKSSLNIIVSSKKKLKSNNLTPKPKSKVQNFVLKNKTANLNPNKDKCTPASKIKKTNTDLLTYHTDYVFLKTKKATKFCWCNNNTQGLQGRQAIYVAHGK